MRINLLFLAAFLLTAAGYSQNTLSGKITSKKDNEPVLGTVYITQLEKGVDTDFDGNYELKNIPNGNFDIIFSALGYNSASKKVRFSNSQKQQLDIQLSESAIEMEAVIVSTPFHRLQRENVIKVEQLSIEKLNDMGAITLADGIQNISGVNIISTGTGIGKPVIRGLSSNRVVTYAQGVRLENQQFGEEHGIGINDSGIESVEVIKGPASLLYGSDALGGVLYINPEKFASPGETYADAGSTYFSNSLGTSNNIGLKTSGEKLQFLMRGAYATFSDYKTGAGYRVTNSRFNEKDIKTGLQFRNAMFRSSLRYNYNRTDVGIPEEVGLQTRSKSLDIPFQEIDNHILSLDNSIFLNKSKLDFTVGYVFNDRREFEEAPTVAELRMKLRTLNYDLKYHLLEMGNFETIFGVQGMFQSNRNSGEEILIPDATTTDFGVLATTHYHTDRFDLQGGIRFDSRKIDSKSAREVGTSDYIPALEKNYTSFTAALGGKYDFSKEFLARLNFASGFRAPNSAELTSRGVHEGTYRYEIGNPDLDTEKNFQTDLSLEYISEHIEIFANGFYNVVDKYIFISPSGLFIDGYPVYNYLQHDANLYGGELGFHLHPHPWDWLHVESSFETVTGRMKNKEYLPLIPANTLRNTLRIAFDDGKLRKSSSAFITLENTFDQNNINIFETRTGGYSLLSAGVQSSFSFDKVLLKVGVNATNLTNKKYIAHLSRFKPDGILDIGRSLNVNVRLSI